MAGIGRGSNPSLSATTPYPQFVAALGAAGVVQPTDEVAVVRGGVALQTPLSQLVVPSAVTYTPPFTNAQPETQQQYNQQRISVVDFMTTAQKNDFFAGTASVDQSSAFTATLAYVSALNGSIIPNAFALAPPGKYYITNSIIVPSTVGLSMYGAIFYGAISAYPWISPTSSPTVPTAGDYVGQTGGACFATAAGAAGAQFVQFEGGQFTNFRYAFVNLGLEINGFRWEDPAFGDINIGIFFYTAAQDIVINNPRCSNTCNVGVVGNATCFTSANALVTAGVDTSIGDFTLTSPEFNNEPCINTVFDTWFQAAILRSGTATAPGYGGTFNLSGYTTALNPTGRVAYLPGRSNSGMFQFHFESIHTFTAVRGAIMLGAAAYVTIQDIGCEADFNDTSAANINAGPPFTESLVVILNCTQVDLVNIGPAFGGNGTGVGPLATIDSRGSGGCTCTGVQGIISYETAFVSINNNGNNEPGTNINANQTPGDGLLYKVAGQTHLPVTQSGSTTTVGSNVLVAMGGVYDFLHFPNGEANQSSILCEEVANFSIPSTASETAAIVSRSGNAGQNEPAAIGKMELYVMRMDTFAQDYGCYLIRMADKSILARQAIGTASTNIVTLATSGATAFANGVPFTIGDGVHTDSCMVQSISSNGLTLTLWNTLGHTYTAGATLSSPFNIDATITALTSGTGWISGIQDDNGAMLITSAIAPTVRLEIKLKFTYHGQPI